jgi:hypothetical protein
LDGDHFKAENYTGKCAGCKILHEMFMLDMRSNLGAHKMGITKWVLVIPGGDGTCFVVPRSVTREIENVSYELYTLPGKYEVFYRLYRFERHILGIN